MSMKFILTTPFNLVAFNLIWLASVIGRYELVWVVLPAVLAYSAFLIISSTVKFHQVGLPAFVGICTDVSLTQMGLFQFDSPSPMLPLWLIALWIAFATTLTQSLSILGRHKLIAGVLGAVFVPLNYIVGARLGAVSFGYDLVLTYAVLSLVWVLLLPLLFYLAGESRRPANAVA